MACSQSSEDHEKWLDQISRCDKPSETVLEHSPDPQEDLKFFGFRGLVHGYTVLYRVISPLEDIENGIFCKAPDSNRTVAQHVASGSTYHSRFISTTSNYEVAANWAFYEMETPEKRPRAVPLRIVKIDMLRLVGTKTEMNCIDLCEQEVREHFIKGATHRSRAVSSMEVLFQDKIPKYVGKQIFAQNDLNFYYVEDVEVYHVPRLVLKPLQPKAKKPKKKKVSLEETLSKLSLNQ